MTDVDLTLSELAKQKACAWRWVRKPDGQRSKGEISIAFTNHGVTLLHSEDASDDEVKAWLVAALDRRTARRKASAAKAVATRQRNHELKVKYVASLHRAGILKPNTECSICGKAIYDEYSQRRGVGPDCWQQVMDYLAVTSELADVPKVF